MLEIIIFRLRSPTKKNILVPSDWSDWNDDSQLHRMNQSNEINFDCFRCALLLFFSAP